MATTKLSLTLYCNRDERQPITFKDTSIDGIITQISSWLWHDSMTRGDGLTLGTLGATNRIVHLAFDAELDLGERWSISDTTEYDGFGATTIEHGWYRDITVQFFALVRLYLEDNGAFNAG